MISEATNNPKADSDNTERALTEIVALAVSEVAFQFGMAARLTAADHAAIKARLRARLDPDQTFKTAPRPIGELDFDSVLTALSVAAARGEAEAKRPRP